MCAPSVQAHKTRKEGRAQQTWSSCHAQGANTLNRNCSCCASTTSLSHAGSSSGSGGAESSAYDGTAAATCRLASALTAAASSTSCKTATLRFAAARDQTTPCKLKLSGGASSARSRNLKTFPPSRQSSHQSMASCIDNRTACARALLMLQRNEKLLHRCPCASLACGEFRSCAFDKKVRI